MTWEETESHEHDVGIWDGELEESGVHFGTRKSG